MFRFPLLFLGESKKCRELEGVGIHIHLDGQHCHAISEAKHTMRELQDKDEDEAPDETPVFVDL